MVMQRIVIGWEASFITVMFNQLKGGQIALMQQMIGQIERIYETFITRVIRKPRSVHIDRLPILIAMADMPAAKHKRQSVRDMLPNGGLHYHGMLLVPPNSRLRTAASDHFILNERNYLGDRWTVSHIDIEPVTTATTGRITDYMAKAYKKMLLDDDTIVVLPRSSGEPCHRDGLIPY